MRFMDLSGEKELSGAIDWMCSLIVAREAGWKILWSSKRVMSRVLEGGAGCERGGKEERSRDKRERFEGMDRGEDAVDVGGELVEC